MSKETSNYLAIAEDFYSLQGEGITTGHPAYFIRLKGCNLTCGASAANLKAVISAGAGNTDSGSFKGDLHTEKKATWTCDSIPVWLFGEKKPFDYLINKWKNVTNYDKTTLFDRISTGQVHLIWTGGEPTIPQHQSCISNFIEHLYTAGAQTVFNEIETNGTHALSPSLFENLQQINCSAKLANSGMSKERRIVPDAIQSIKEHWNYWFKFVISTEDDIKEFIADYLEPYNIPMGNVVCMPGLDSQEEFFERTQFVMEMAKKYGFTGLTRNHIAAWGKVTGV